MRTVTPTRDLITFMLKQELIDWKLLTMTIDKLKSKSIVEVESLSDDVLLSRYQNIYDAMLITIPRTESDNEKISSMHCTLIQAEDELLKRQLIQFKE